MDYHDLMGRRSDHSRSELRALVVAAGHDLMGEVGFASFSAREVARRVGYSVGTLYNIFDNLDHLVIAINSRTFAIWTDYLRQKVDDSRGDRLRALVEAYFAFARNHPRLWMAIYDHRLPAGMPIPEEFLPDRSALTNIVIREVGAALPESEREQAPRLARSLIATVHGHCTFDLDGTFELMGVTEPVELALSRVRDSLTVAALKQPPINIAS